jgi:protease-4
LVDKVGYFDEFLNELSELSGKDKKLTPDFVSMQKYTGVAATEKDKPFTKDRIAVIYAAGEIVSGKGGDGEIGGAELSETIRKARLDTKVKAIVLRVNSPGGDAMASDVIWREVLLARKAKPFVVSMGDVAASGGYYISCAADTIVAQPNTITGSIGVFGLMFNLEKMFENKLGVTFDSYKTSDYADLGTMTRPMTDAERRIIETWIDQVYKTFTSRIADGRNMPLEMVDSLGQGRVWSGRDAQQAGLVDVLGGLDTAIEIAAGMAGITNYRLRELPEQKDPFVEILEDISGEAQSRWLSYTMGENYQLMNELQRLSRIDGIQARQVFSVKLR